MELNTQENTQEIKEEKTKTPSFVKGEKFPLYDEDGNQIQNWSGIRDANNKSKFFAPVSDVYNLVQHQDVYDKAVDALSELSLENKMSWTSMNDGGRYQWRINFPTECIRLGVDGELIDAQITIDNSYDKSTGLRVSVQGVHKKVRYYIGDSYAYFYGKHTKNLEKENMKKDIQKGINVFQVKMAEKFQLYYSTFVSKEIAVEKLIDMLDQTKVVVAKKYVKTFISATKKAEINTVWDLYSLFSEVMSLQSSSPDVEEKVSKYMDSWLQRNWKTITK